MKTSHPYWTEHWKVLGSKTLYTVGKNRKGGWGCTCPAFLFRGHKECKHIRMIQGMIGMGTNGAGI